MKVRCSVRKVYCQPVLTGWFGKCYVISVCLVQFNSSYQLHCHPHQRQVSFLLSLPTTAMNYYPRHPINPFYVFNIYYRFQSVVSHAGIASNCVFYPHFSYWNFLFFLSSTVSLQLHLIGHLLYTQPCSLISFYARLFLPPFMQEMKPNEQKEWRKLGRATKKVSVLGVLMLCGTYF